MCDRVSFPAILIGMAIQHYRHSRVKPVFFRAAFWVLLAGALPGAPCRADAVAQNVDGREALVYVPANLPAKGARAPRGQIGLECGGGRCGAPARNNVDDVG